MKSINTLVEDIYGLFKDDNWKPTDTNVQEFGQRLSRHIANRASETRGKPTLRLSNIGLPDRKLWFTINRPGEAETLAPNVRIKFLFGDILEELLLFLAKEAGHDVTGAQDTIEINGVIGHRDAVIDGHLVDCKSASSFAFKKFEEHGLAAPGADPFGYLDQLGAYHYGSTDVDKDVASFLAIDKQLGKITLDTYPRNQTNYEDLIEQKKSVIEMSSPPDTPCYEPVPDGKSGNEKLSVGCSYCPFKWSCWKDLRGFYYSNGPTYLTKVEREPKVPEFDKTYSIISKF